MNIYALKYINEVFVVIFSVQITEYNFFNENINPPTNEMIRYVLFSSRYF